MKIPLYRLELVPDGELELPDRFHAIEHSFQAADLFRHVISQANTEEFWAVYLCGLLYMRFARKVAEGEGTFVAVPLREILLPALEYQCDSFMLGHNHPSGEPAPSAEDRAATRQIEGAAQLIGSRLVDHVIVTQDRHFSFMDERLIRHVTE